MNPGVDQTPNCFDIAAYHPYGLPEQFHVSAEKYRGLMTVQGITGRPLWFNEYGTTEDNERAELIVKAFAHSNAADAFFWFTLRDLAPIGENYGVLDYQYTQKPEYQTLKDSYMNAQKTTTSSSIQP